MKRSTTAEIAAELAERNAEHRARWRLRKTTGFKPVDPLNSAERLACWLRFVRLRYAARLWRAGAPARAQAARAAEWRRDHRLRAILGGRA